MKEIFFFFFLMEITIHTHTHTPDIMKLRDVSVGDDGVIVDSDGYRIFFCVCVCLWGGIKGNRIGPN